MSNYEMRATTHGLRIVDAATGETVTLDGRLLDGLSAAAAAEIVALLGRRDALRAERMERVRSGDDLGAILELEREAADSGQDVG